jgi:hypothetical protein
VVEHPKILHSKFLLERGNDAVEQRLARGGENNVIHIEEQISSLTPIVVYEQRGVRLGHREPKSLQEGSESRVPSPWCLLEPVERFVEPADQVRTRRIHETGRLTAVDRLSQSAMEEGILDIQLMQRPGALESQ